MNQFKIKAKPQANGLFGTPMECVFIDKVIFGNNNLLQSAIIIGISERYPKEPFTIINSTLEGFTVRLNKRIFVIKYKNYSFSGDTITWLK